ncbi:MAG: hypothetical protein DWQ04_28065 [Chloroflexi bacterium]|nr:MAG: hypothetical protein DWQ04_28065 [Chloroflexota bacterium]
MIQTFDWPLRRLLWMLLLIGMAGCQQAAKNSIEETAVPDTLPTMVSTASDRTSLPPPQVGITAVSPQSSTINETQPSPTSVPTIDPQTFGPGSLIAVSMDGRVGVRLNEFPETMRDRVAETILAESDDYWIALAQRQLDLTYHRLNFRNFITAGKGQLPLPPTQLWQITLDTNGPSRQTIEGNDFLVHAYQFESTLLTDTDSPGEAEPTLAEIGGVWDEPFIFPLDPDLLLQRTGNACVNESGFPPNSFDSENISIFYDYACTPQSTGPLGCHRTFAPDLSCLEAIDGRNGRFETTIRYKRLRWDAALADQVRIGPVTHLNAPDMQVVAEDLHNNRIIYRYFTPESCALQENAVGAAGWRRLLQFDATLYNVGGEALEIGPIVTEDPLTNMFQYNACHDHFHFSNYGAFEFASEGQTSGSKQAFCVESTDRYSNNETSPLTHPYSCSYQGIQAGWVDEYDAGLDVQWIDITDVAFEGETAVAELSFLANLDQFLCEGTLTLDGDGNQLFEPSGFRTETGLPINRPQCDFSSNWNANNAGSLTLSIPASGSFVTEPCSDTHPGPLRNCGFVAHDELFSCEVGSEVGITAVIDTETIPQLIRVCEISDKLKTGIACTFQDAITNVVIAEKTSQNTTTCPAIRDAETFSGGFSLYIAPAFVNDAIQKIEIRQE